MDDNKVRGFLFQRMDGMIPLRKGLDAFSLRQKVHSSNIANAETPEYVAKKVTFEDQLKNVLDKSSNGMQRTHTEHIPVRGGLKRLFDLRAEVVNDDNPLFYNGVNNIDVDKEMARMATNQIHYSVSSKLISARYALLMKAITGRG